MKESFFKVNKWEEDFIIQEKIAHAKAKYLITVKWQIDVDYSIFYVYYDKKIYIIHLLYSKDLCFLREVLITKANFILEDSEKTMNIMLQQQLLKGLAQVISQT